jgi:hypothetical protein
MDPQPIEEALLLKFNFFGKKKIETNILSILETTIMTSQIIGLTIIQN